MKDSNQSSISYFKYFISFLAGSLILVLIFLAEIIQAQEIIKIAPIEDSKDKILVVTNRAYDKVSNYEIDFKPELSSDKDHVYLIAQHTGDDWVYQQEFSLNSMLSNEVEYEDWVVFVHGDGKTLETSIERAREIQKLHQVNVLVYSWPSKDMDMNGIRNFKNSYKNVELSATEIYTFLQELNAIRSSDSDPFEGQNVTLFLHSLGNYYLERLAYEGLLGNIEETIFDNLIINAAAVEQDGHDQWVEQIQFAERIYINSNDDDMSLSGLRFLTKLGRQLGESALEPFASNAIYVNFTDAVGFPGSMGPSHSYYFASVTEKSENIREYYSTILHGKEAELFNESLFTYVPEETSFSIKF